MHARLKTELQGATLAVGLVVLVFCPWATAASLRPCSLTCEYHENPLAIDVAEPGLSWKLQPVEKSESPPTIELDIASPVAQQRMPEIRKALKDVRINLTCFGRGDGPQSSVSLFVTDQKLLDKAHWAILTEEAVIERQ